MDAQFQRLMALLSAMFVFACALMVTGRADAAACPTGPNGTLVWFTVGSPTITTAEKWYQGVYTAGMRNSACAALIPSVMTQRSQQLFFDDATYTYSNWSGEHRPNDFLCMYIAKATRTTRSDGTVTQVATGDLQAIDHHLSDQCEPPPPGCDPTFPGVGDTWVSGGEPSYCHALSNCKVTRGPGACIDGSCSYTYTHTSQDCSSSDPPTEDGPPGEGCTGGDVEFCKDSDDGGENCGFLNGNFVCLGQTENDGCQVFGDGSRVCGPDAPSPPVPDDGNPGGNPAPPDEVIEVTDSDGNTTINNYYNSNTVNNSNRPPGTSGDNPHDGEDDGSGEIGGGTVGGNGGEGEGTDDDGCTEEDGCTGTLPGIGEEGDCTSFGACLTEFYGRLASAPIVEAVSNVGDSFPAGACPAVNVSMFGETNSISSPMCDIWSGTIAPLIGVMFLVIFAWVSTRIVLSA